MSTPTCPAVTSSSDCQCYRSILLRPGNKREHVAKFLQSTIGADPAGAASATPSPSRYIDWCGALLVDPLPAEELGLELRSIVDAIGLEYRNRGKDVIVCGAPC